MRRILTAVTLAALSVGLGVGLAGTAVAAPSDQDTVWLKGNAQTNLAEITLAGITMTNGQSTGVMNLATVTKTDHTAALATVKKLAASKNIDLPTAPNADQKATAAKLSGLNGGAYDLAYATAQVAGHVKSIAGTETELSSGTDADIVAFAKYYLPVAQKHLVMAEQLVTDLGGSTPNAVPAGTGGEFATTSPAQRAGEIGAGTAGLLLVIGGGVALYRRRNARI